jgi:predicted TPR repeat methyltransferase
LLKDCGHFVFTIEEMDIGNPLTGLRIDESHEGKGFYLLPSGRFGHSLDYVKDLLARDHRFQIAVVDTQSIRKQHHMPVKSFTISLKKLPKEVS